jgi:hypothetical protein
MHSISSASDRERTLIATLERSKAYAIEAPVGTLPHTACTTDMEQRRRSLPSRTPRESRESLHLGRLPV